MINDYLEKFVNLENPKFTTQHINSQEILVFWEKEKIFSFKQVGINRRLNVPFFYVHFFDARLRYMYEVLTDKGLNFEVIPMVLTAFLTKKMPV
jgi:hypothetical protein